ncbi:hypothetical protein HF909_10690 [Ralstonia pseudosolanacearum]|uniref:Uncharacterized protein n=1 Tax=Ralstonia solanacearum TaxID=305 RepID=A0AA92K1K4_RALSL|nr:hypothetical protein [Ralstonia pseudosolanacearum]QOK96851.1 hypothetical protein HF909_10690 [Ralstonia pseudosolanacearum]
MLKMILKLIRARQDCQDAAPAPAAPSAAAPAPTTAPAPRKDRRKLRRAKRRASPGARKIDPNGQWLEQARGGKR